MHVRFLPPPSDIRIEAVEPPPPGSSHPLSSMNRHPSIARRRVPTADRAQALFACSGGGEACYSRVHRAARPDDTRIPNVSSVWKPPNFGLGRSLASGVPPGRAFGLLSSHGAWRCLRRRARKRAFSFPALPAPPPWEGKTVHRHATNRQNHFPPSHAGDASGRNRGTFRFPPWRKWDKKELPTDGAPYGPQARGRQLRSLSDKASHEEKRPNVAREGYGFALEKRLSECASRRVFGMFLFQGAWPCLLHGTSNGRAFPFPRAPRMHRHPGKGESRKRA